MSCYAVMLLCKGTKFVTVEESLKLLKQRLDGQGSEIQLIAIDNCCKWIKSFNILSFQTTRYRYFLNLFLIIAYTKRKCLLNYI